PAKLRCTQPKTNTRVADGRLRSWTASHVCEPLRELARLRSLPPALLVRLGADLLPGPPRRLGAGAVHRLRPGTDRAGRRPDPRRGRGAASPGLPDEARADPLVPLPQCVHVRALSVPRTRRSVGPGRSDD